MLLRRFRVEAERGDSGGGMGEDGAETDARIRRCDIRVSKDSSYGKENSSLKNGCLERFSEGDGERMEMGVELLECGV